MRVKIYSELDLIDAKDVDTMAQARKIAKQYAGEVDYERPDSPAFVKIINIKNNEETVTWFEIEEESGKLTKMNLEESQDLEYEFSDEPLKESGWFGDLLTEEFEELSEARRKKRVSSDGSTSYVKKGKSSSSKRRSTGMSKSARKRRAKKAAKTRSKSGSTQRKANKKRSKAMRKRRSRGM